MFPYLGFKTLFISIFVDSDIIDKRNRKTQDMMRLREVYYYGKSDLTLMNCAIENENLGLMSKNNSSLFKAFAYIIAAAEGKESRGRQSYSKSKDGTHKGKSHSVLQGKVINHIRQDSAIFKIGDCSIA